MTKQAWNVAVVGAAGMVGTEMIRTLEQRHFPVAELRPLDTAAVAGTAVSFQGRSLPCLEATEANLAGVHLAIFSAGGDASLELAPAAVRQGAVVVDNSSAWRMDPACPLVVPEVNPRDLAWHRGIIANPNCSTIQLVVALKPLHDRARILRIVVSTYQAASGAGKHGVDELAAQARAVLDGLDPSAPRTFQHRLAFNLIPQIDVFREGDYTKEEWKMVHETRKILGDASIRVTATTVRVPVFVGHSESVNIETEEKLSPDEARRLLAAAPGVCVIDDPSNRRYPMPADAAGTDGVFVGRIREDQSIERGLNLWIVADNVRKGAALNAVQIAERLVADGLVRLP
ncbi:MAG TPA: aspartate-semialdehyde dehydrogenase [Vicinamibacterales bacterium]|nr:aspartate-semialdehyde dehydrogenase [Vicinamibacterales bacterium]